MIKKTIVYVGPVEYTSNSAAARRIKGVVESLTMANYRVIVGSGSSDISGGGNIDSLGTEIYPVGDRAYQNKKAIISKLFEYFKGGQKTVDWLNSLDCQIECVILYSGYSPFLVRLLKWNKLTKVPIVFDAVEWYEGKTKISHFLNPYYWNIEYAMRILVRKTGNVIAISRFLSNYYINDCNTVIIPPLNSLLTPATTNSNKINQYKVISYTGSPGHKDLFNNMLEAVIQVNDKNKNVVFHTAGIESDTLLKYNAFTSRSMLDLPDYILAEGRVTHQRAVEITSNADFSILQRSISRVSKAGFPTKVVESLSLSTPVITNLTSDLSNHLKDFHNSVIVKNEKVGSLVEALMKVVNLSRDQIKEMSNNAFLTAKNDFHPSNYAIIIDNFIKNIN